MNRKLDNLGRIVIPKEIRKSLNIKDDDELNIICEDNKIILTPAKKDNRIDKAIEFVKTEHNTYPSAEEWRQALINILKGDK